METTEAPTPAPPRRSWLPRVFAVAVLLAAVVVALVRFDVIGGQSPEERAGDVRAALTTRLVSELEKMPASGHAGHGNANATGKPLCEARVFGYEPADAATADDVQTVYGYHFCAVAEPKGSWDFATKLVAPMKVDMTTTPPAWDMAAATETVSYRDRITQIFPPEYQQEANEAGLEPDAMADLRRRFEDAVADA